MEKFYYLGVICEPHQTYGSQYSLIYDTDKGTYAVYQDDGTYLETFYSEQEFNNWYNEQNWVDKSESEWGE